MAYGSAFGVPHRNANGFAALAWVFDQNPYFAAVGVYTPPRFRRLGLAARRPTPCCGTSAATAT